MTDFGDVSRFGLQKSEIVLFAGDLFARRVSCNRFVELQKRCLTAWFFYLARKHGACTAVSFIDAIGLKVCHNLRIPSHKVFWGSAARDKSSTGWYFGFKLHLAAQRARRDFRLLSDAAANCAERETADWITRDLWGKLVDDKGYISQELFEKLMRRGLKPITRPAPRYEEPAA